MHIEKYYLDELTKVNINDLTFDFIKSFYLEPSNKNELIHILDNNVYKGYLNIMCLNNISQDYDLPIRCLDSKWLIKSPYRIPEIYEWFSNNPDENVLASIDNFGHLKELYIRLIPDNIEKHHIALVAIKAFPFEFQSFLLNENCSSIIIDSSVHEFNIIKSLLPQIQCVRFYQYYNSNKMKSENITILTLNRPTCLYSIYYNRKKERIIKLTDIIEEILLKILVTNCKQNNIDYYFIEGPIKNKIVYNETDEPYLAKKHATLTDAIKNKSYMSLFYNYDEDSLRNTYDLDHGLMAGSYVTTNCVHLLQAKYNSKYTNVLQKGERKTTLPKDNFYKKQIWCYGTCLTFGLFSNDEETFPSHLQQLFNKHGKAVKVHNCGVNGRLNKINDLLYALNSDITPGDGIVFVWEFSKKNIEILHKLNVDIIIFSKYLNKHKTSPYCFLDHPFHCNKLIYSHLADFIYKNIKKDKKQKMSLKCNYNLKNSLKGREFNTLYGFQEILLVDYIRMLEHTKVKYLNYYQKDAKIGCVIITANPFTNGHAYLIDYAASKCDLVYVFVIQENLFQYSFLERYSMVENYIKDSPNICILPAGVIITAKFMFPGYFNIRKNSINEFKNPKIQTEIFCNIVLKKLSINCRFLGNEPIDKTTNSFNDYLIKTMPKYGIRVFVIERKKQDDDKVISACSVREIISKFGLEDERLKTLLPTSTIEIIRQKC